MNRVVIILLLFLLSTACNLFKNTSTAIDQSHQLLTKQTSLKNLEEKDRNSTSNRLTFYKDSDHQQYQVQFWPKGRFTFSSEQGFSGEADQVIISGNLNRTATAAQLVHVDEQDKGKISTNLSQQEKKVFDQRQKVSKSFVSWKWVLAGIVILSIMLWLGYKKLTTSNHLKI